MATRRVSDLVGEELDRAVARARGRELRLGFAGTMAEKWLERVAAPDEWVAMPRPSEDWAEGGPIIEEHRIELQFNGPAGWRATEYNFAHAMDGDTPLVAAMRVFVRNELGPAVDL